MKLFALDIETTSLDWLTGEILCIGVYAPDTGYKGFTSVKDFLDWNDPSHQYICHNGSFDTAWLRHHASFDNSQWAFDTKSMATILFPAPKLAEGQASVYGLENLYISLLGGNAYKLDRNDMSSYTRTEVLQYNERDCRITWDLFSYLLKRYDKRDYEFLHSWLMPATKLCAELEFKGILVDKELLTEYYDETVKAFAIITESLNLITEAPRRAWQEKQELELKKTYEQMTEQALLKLKDPSKADKTKARYAELFEKAKTKLEPFNFSSNTQLKWLLKDYYNLDIFSEREEKETTNEAMLKRHGDHRVVAELLHYRSYDKLLSSSIPAILDNIRTDGRVHGRFNIGGTITGRLSSSNPNLQQCPKKSPIRSALIAPRGYVWVSSDLGQIEPRIIAHASGDKTLIETFQKGWDIYSVLGLKLFGPESGLGTTKVENKYRDCAKTLALACFYGVGPNKFREQVFKDLGIELTYDKAKEQINAFLKQFPGVVKLRQRLERDMANGHAGGKTHNLLGRPITIENPEFLRNALNVYVQGSASDLLIYAAFTHIIPKLQSLGIKYEPLSLIHDEFNIAVEESTLEVSRGIIERGMTTDVVDSLNLSIPLKTELVTAKCWSK